MEVAVCVITYKRPIGLARLLEGLNQLTFAGDPPCVRCVIVENDESGTAATVCDEARAGFQWELESYTEPRRGIPFARNTAVARAQDGADFIAFIDDDEVPEPTWLDELLRVQREYRSDVVAGPVVPFFEEPPPAWVIKGRFYDRNRRATGQRLDRAFTNNILFRRQVFDAMDTHFDERMALTGGSDSQFLQRVHRAGFSIVWADEAIATEWVPPSRVGAKWILQRAFRYGTTLAFIRRDSHTLPVSVTLQLVLGSYRIARGLVLLPLGLLLGRHEIVACARQVCYGAGMLLGITGMRYHEYRRTHGE